jgi:DNA-directed RNA polymerase specialized sigma24 family protein
VPELADEAGAAGYRPRLFSIAYGMTGSVGDAEDIVQDAFLGLTRARQAGTAIADPQAYLATAVTRLGIDYLGSARVRRETYVGTGCRSRWSCRPTGRGGPSTRSWLLVDMEVFVLRYDAADTAAVERGHGACKRRSSAV